MYNIDKLVGKSKRGFEKVRDGILRRKNNKEDGDGKITQTTITKLVKSAKVKTDKGEPIAEFQDLHLGFTSKTSSKYKEVIRGVDLKIYPGEVLGILGESGSGKTVLTMSLLGILSEYVQIKSGSIFVGGVDITNFNKKDWNNSKLRGPVLSAIFQNPMKTLNPVRTIEDQFIETLAINNRADNRREALELAKNYLEITKIKNVDGVLKLYPHELSGGMIQRIVIAMALATEAQLIIMDEPTTALDPVVQAEIINLVMEIKEKFHTAFVFISHDIGVIGSVADKIAIMYAGRIVEYGSNREIIWNPKHPYTWNLLMAMPDLNQEERLFTIPGSVPADSTGVKSEVFAARNNYALNVDFKAEAPKVEISDTHSVYSFLYTKKAPSFKPPKLIEQRWKQFKQQSKTIGVKNGKRN